MNRVQARWIHGLLEPERACILAPRLLSAPFVANPMPSRFRGSVWSMANHRARSGGGKSCAPLLRR